MSSPTTIESAAVTRGQTPATDEAEGDEAIQNGSAEEHLPEKVIQSLAYRMVGWRSSSISARACSSRRVKGGKQERASQEGWKPVYGRDRKADAMPLLSRYANALLQLRFLLAQSTIYSSIIADKLNRETADRRKRDAAVRKRAAAKQERTATRQANAGRTTRRGEADEKAAPPINGNGNGNGNGAERPKAAASKRKPEVGSPRFRLTLEA